MASAVRMRSRIVRASCGQAVGELLRGGYDLAVAQLEGGAPALAPSVGIALVVGPSEVVGQLADDSVEVEPRVEPLSHSSTLSVGRS